MALAQPPMKFLGKYLVMQDCAEGGQAFVQFARGGEGGFFQYAIKCAPFLMHAPHVQTAVFFNHAIRVWGSPHACLT
jgi:hypothetical protein